MSVVCADDGAYASLPSRLCSGMGRGGVLRLPLARAPTFWGQTQLKRMLLITTSDDLALDILPPRTAAIALPHSELLS